MHNEQLANPLSPASQRLKALTGKRKKTDEDHEAIARAEFDGGLYINDNGPFIPDHWIAAMIRDGGKLLKLGTAVTRGVTILSNGFPLYLPERFTTADQLWDAGYYDQRMVGNQKVRILRTRPRFETWDVTCKIHYDPSIFDERQLIQIIEGAGMRIGLGDYRPRYGRFELVNEL